MAYKRVLLKLTGELFCEEGSNGINIDEVTKIATYLGNLHENHKTQIAVVVGGGNIFRGRSLKDKGFDEVDADYIGMLGTVLNGLTLQLALNAIDVPCEVMTQLYVNQACAPFIYKKAKKHLSEGNILILVGGSGLPHYSTDSAAANFASQLKCDILLKGSNVDGVYNLDPNKYDNAVKYSKISFQKVIEDGLQVMDLQAFAHCKTHNIPIKVFNLSDMKNIERILDGDTSFGTLIEN